MFLPIVGAAKNIANSLGSVQRTVSERVTFKIRELVNATIQDLSKMYPQDWESFCLSATRDVARMKTDIIQNKAHPMIMPAADRADELLAEMKAFTSGAFGEGADSVITLSAAIESARHFVSCAGVLNLVVCKKNRGTFTAKELGGMADGAIGILKKNKRWEAPVEGAKEPCEPTVVPDSLRVELEELVRAGAA